MTLYQQRLADLRGTVSNEQRQILDTIWQYFRQGESWMTLRNVVVSTKMDMSEILRLLEPLGGSVVTLTTQQTFNLRLAGLLLSSDGEQIEELITKCYAYVKRRSLTDADIQYVRERELIHDLEMSSADSALLFKALSGGSLLNPGRNSAAEWVLQLPQDIDSISRNTDFHELVLERAFQYFEPGLPVDESLQHSYRASNTRASQILGEFWFVKDEKLRQMLVSEWLEAQVCFTNNCVKACVILCGSTLEGLLLNALAPDEDRARTELQRVRTERTAKDAKKPGKLEEWDLTDLLEVARRFQTLGGIELNLSGVIKDYRNLVHLGRQLRISRAVSIEDATLAFNAVKVCIRALDSRARMQISAPGSTGT